MGTENRDWYKSYRYSKASEFCPPAPILASFFFSSLGDNFIIGFGTLSFFVFNNWLLWLLLWLLITILSWNLRAFCPGFSERTNVAATDRSGSVSKARVKSGLLMKHYQGKLSQIRIPLSDKVLLKYGRQLEKALRHMHSCGYCHLDVKPSNVFISKGSGFLGDYGAARPTGSEVMKVTCSYYPKTFPSRLRHKPTFCSCPRRSWRCMGKSSHRSSQ